VAEHGAVLSEVTVSRYVTRRRVELDLVHVEVYIPQSHEPGGEAEADFGEFYGEGLDVRDASVAPQRTRLPSGAIFDPDTSGRLTQGSLLSNLAISGPLRGRYPQSNRPTKSR